MERVEVIWGHVATEDNPTHRASRDKLVSKEIVRACINNIKVGDIFSQLVGSKLAHADGSKVSSEW